MTISLIVPHKPFPEADAALERCLKSFKGQYDELILVINENWGYGKAVNYGLKQATGEYLIISNNDIELIQGSIKHLPFGDLITVPIITPEPRDYKPRSIFCMHKSIYEDLMKKYGYFYDERFGAGYFEDDDLDIRLKILGRDAYLKDIGTIVSHLNGGGLTMKKVGEYEWFDRNEKIFKDKWSSDIYS